MSSIATLVIGPSGHGKSTSARNLDPSETVIISVTGKPLPFPKAREYSRENKNYFITKSASKIIKILDKLKGADHVKNIVIDDFQYLMSFEFMDRAQESGWDKFTEIGLHAFDVIQKATSLRGDQKVFILAHEETEKSGIKTRRKIKTIGKMLDDKINLEGLFTIVVFTEIRPQEEDIQERYKFSTQTDSESTAKAPMGMFDEKYIPNDLQFMAKKINDFYGRKDQ